VVKAWQVKNSRYNAESFSNAVLVMNIAVSQDLSRSRGISEVSAKAQSKAVAGQQRADTIVLPAEKTSQGVRSSAAVLSQLDDALNQQQRTAYDQPQARQQKALAAYQQLETFSKREQIQQVFGVDLFA
jgi:hypothetical protein